MINDLASDGSHETIFESIVTDAVGPLQNIIGALGAEVCSGSAESKLVVYSISSRHKG